MKPKKKLKQRSLRYRMVQIALVGTVFALVATFLMTLIGRSRDNGLDLENVHLIQLEMPADSAPVAVFETTAGNFQAVLYPEQAPDYVDYFTGLVNSGYYDNTYVYAVEQSVYFLGGAKSADGSETGDTDTKTYEPEKSADLWTLPGALCAYGESKGFFNRRNLAGSRVLFVNSVEFTDDFKNELQAVDGNPTIINAFIEHGGVPNFAQQYTVFGQVIGGMDAYIAIASAGGDDSETKSPAHEIKFNRVYMTTYGAVKATLTNPPAVLNLPSDDSAAQTTPASTTPTTPTSVPTPAAVTTTQ
ncbi:MAG: peptidylprolyl isomerase [Oscillospiraceae bacterium]